MWFAVLLTLTASAAISIGKVLQKDATRSLPRFSLRLKVVKEHLYNRAWVVGLSLDLGGALFMVAAYALAPVSVVQPVGGSGLGITAVFSHFYLKERLQAAEWASVAVASLGTVVLGATLEDPPPGHQHRTPGLLRVAAVLLLALGTLSFFSLARQRSISRHKRKPATASKSAGAWSGLQAGMCFGLSGTSCRVGFVAASTTTLLAAPLGLGGSLLLSSLGFVLQTVGLKDGHTLIVCTCAAVASISTGVVVGVVGLGEEMPSTVTLSAARLLAWAMILLGVTALASGQGGIMAVLRKLMQFLPQRVSRLMPGTTKHARMTSDNVSHLPVFAATPSEQ